MKIILDAHYAPCLAWWVLLVRAEEIVLEKHSYIRKASYRNRCHIFGANGLLRLSIPVIRGGGKRSIIKDVQISYDHEWQKLHWDSMCSAYRSSPYFEFYEQDFEGLYQDKVLGLFDFNLLLINKVIELLGIKKNIGFTENYLPDYGNTFIDCRELIHPNPSKDETTSWYKFEDYIQVFQSKVGPIQNLSILDLLFNEGPASLTYLQNTALEIPTS